MKILSRALLLALAAATVYYLVFMAPPPVPAPDTKGGSAESPPNILLILADDLGNNDLGSFGDGSIETPNIDQLAVGGVSFTRHYAHATCRPSRAALLTGMPASRVAVPPYFRGIPPEFTTLPEALQVAGYQTAHIGKWHLGYALPSARPDRQGFDEWYGFLAALATKNGSLKRQGVTYHDPFLQENGAEPVKQQGHMTDLLTNRAIDTIARFAGEERPWFINLWYFAPHTPIQPGADFAARFPDTGEGRYLALVAQLDAAVGRLVTALEERGLRDNTLIVFASDNGGLNKARDNNAPFFGVKNSFREGGLRTPLILNQPNQLAAAVVTEPVFISDLMPTLLAAAGATTPPEVEGRSLWPLLAGQSIPPVEHYFWEMQLAGQLDYGVLDLTEGTLTSGRHSQPWNAASNRFDRAQPASAALLARAANQHAAWRDAVRATDPAKDSYRRTPGYGAWSLQATVPDTPGKHIQQKGQFNVLRRDDDLAIDLPGHRFELPLPATPGTRLTLNSYYAWTEFNIRKSKGIVEVLYDREPVYRKEFPIRDKILKDRYPPLQASPGWGEVEIRNDFLPAGLEPGKRTMPSQNLP